MTEKMSIEIAEELLGLPDVYTEQDVNDAFRTMIAEKHPDVRRGVSRDRANDDAAKLNSAKTVLIRRFKRTGEKSFRRVSSSNDRNDKDVHHQEDLKSNTRVGADPEKPRTSSKADAPDQTRAETPRRYSEPSYTPIEEKEEDLGDESHADYYSWEKAKSDMGEAWGAYGVLLIPLFIIEAFFIVKKWLLCDGDYPEKYQKRVNRIKRATGRVAVCLYSTPLLVAMFYCANSADLDVAQYGNAMFFGLLFVVAFNLLFPIVTGLIRHLAMGGIHKELSS